MQIDGISTAKSLLQKYRLKKKQQLVTGLMKAGLLVQRASQQMVPVDYGILKASAFTRNESGFGQFSVAVGYTAAYAIYVHENLDAAHGAWFNQKYAAELAARPKKGPFRHNRGPDQAAKFLEIPFRRMRVQIGLTIREELKK